MTTDCISEDEFWSEWGVIQKSSGVMFESEDLRALPVNHVWTVLESDDDLTKSWYAAPGFRLVNRIGHVLTEKPWTDAGRDAIYLDASEHES